MLSQAAKVRVGGERERRLHSVGAFAVSGDLASEEFDPLYTRALARKEGISGI